MSAVCGRVCAVVIASITACFGCSPRGPSLAPTPSVGGGGAVSQTQVHFSALVQAVSGTCPSLTLTAGTRKVLLVRPTTFQSGACADIARGKLLDVEGVVGDKGNVLAERIVVASDGPGAVGLLTDVAAGGYVLFFRHSERDAGALPSSVLAEVDNRGECRAGSELTTAGRADAAALGERFQRYGITVDKVYASPTCRAIEMARLAFGRFETTRALTWAGMWGPGEEEALAPELRSLLANVPAAGTNTVLISHNDVLRATRVGVDVTLDQAEAAVFRPHGANTFEFLGKIPKAEWKGQ